MSSVTFQHAPAIQSSFPIAFKSSATLNHLKAATNLFNDLQTLETALKKMVTDSATIVTTLQAETTFPGGTSVWNTVQGVRAWAPPIQFAAQDAGALGTLATNYIGTLNSVLSSPTQSTRVSLLWGFIENLRNWTLQFKMPFSTFETTVNSAVANFDAVSATLPAGTSNPAGLLVDAYSTTVVNTRGTTNQVLGGFLESIQEDAAGVLVWALADELGREDTMPDSLKMLKATGNCVYSQSSAILSDCQSDVLNWLQTQ